MALRPLATGRMWLPQALFKAVEWDSRTDKYMSSYFFLKGFKMTDTSGWQTVLIPSPLWAAILTLAAVGNLSKKQNEAFSHAVLLK